MLAGDPHLPQTLPSIWFEAALSAPGLAVSGVSVPGLPAILIGHNSSYRLVADGYPEPGDDVLRRADQSGHAARVFLGRAVAAHAGVHYTIPVRGAAARQIYVPLTVHGPVLTQAGQTVAVSWMGALGSPDVAAMLGIDRATDFGQFRAALADWRSPALTFVYADDHGNIGAIAAGYYPQVRNGDPWLPLPGTGADDVAGVIPYAAVPQVYDPRSHVIATANQRPVGPSYPYYLGTTANFFDAGYRADAEYAYLRTHWSMRAVQLRRAPGQYRRPAGGRDRAEAAGGASSVLSGWQAPDPDSAGGAANAGFVEQEHGRRVGCRVDLVDVLERLPVGRVRTVVDRGQGAGNGGYRRPCRRSWPVQPR